MALDTDRDAGLVEDIDPAPAYRESIASLVNLDAIRAAGLDVIVDAMPGAGAGAGFIPGMLKGGTTTVTELRAEVNPSFPGMAQPEPIAHNPTELCRRVPSDGASAGLALDGDADRIGLVDGNGAVRQHPGGVLAVPSGAGRPGRVGQGRDRVGYAEQAGPTLPRGYRRDAGRV